MKTRGNSTRHGFTLVELLVVIVIIAILAGLLVVGVMAALKRGKEAAISTEIMGLTAAIETYKNQYDHYPPSFVDERQAHVNQIHPRSVGNEKPVPTTLPSGSSKPVTVAHLLHFWLAGYTTNAQLPLYGVGEGRATPFFDFDKGRLLPELTNELEADPEYRRPREYHPKGTPRDIPYVYFRKIYVPATQTYVWGNQEYGTTEYGRGDIGKVYFQNEVLMVDELVGSDTKTSVLAKNLSKDFVIISAGLERRYTKDGIITSFQDGSED
jgi:prepilin-type N-terminal cleavage/methylation domain-containing protein